MRTIEPAEAIPAHWAASLCDDVTQENRHKWHTLGRWLCWRCWTFGRGEPAKKCYCRRADNRGCRLVNARYAHYYWAFHH